MVTRELASFAEAEHLTEDVRRRLYALVARLILQTRDATRMGRGEDVDDWAARLRREAASPPFSGSTDIDETLEAAHADRDDERALDTIADHTSPPVAQLAARVTLRAEASADQPQALAGRALKTRPELDLGTRYRDVRLLGVGGMGEVRRVFDHDLRRSVAMKIIKAELLSEPSSLARFIEEAQVGAQLQHPGLIPVHDVGQLPDRRVYFTMQEVRGRTLKAAIQEVHAASLKHGSREAAPSGWTRRRLLSAFQRVCDTLGYAHARGVVHRDLKPSNIMLGDSDEVLVVDWGVAKVLAAEPAHPSHASRDPPHRARRDPPHHAPTDDHTHDARDQLTPNKRVETMRSRDGSQATRHGVVAGTPAYMPPEQALGHIDQIDARAMSTPSARSYTKSSQAHLPTKGRTPGPCSSKSASAHPALCATPARTRCPTTSSRSASGPWRASPEIASRPRERWPRR